MPAEIASVVLFSSDAAGCARFYIAAGIPLEDEQHEDGPVHFAAAVGSVHFAVYQADGTTTVVEHRQPGEVFFGFYVDSLDDVVASLAGIGANQSGPHEAMPWGCRVLFRDPDGRTIEINDRQHPCRGRRKRRLEVR
jgi:lactoylglutathione lyase